MTIDDLIEDYKRKVEQISKLLAEGGDITRINRLDAKSGCYQTFITELERLRKEI